MRDIDGIRITIKSATRYRIMDPLQFFKTLKPEHTARSCLGDIVTASLRIEVTDNSSSEIIDGEPVLDTDGALSQIKMVYLSLRPVRPGRIRSKTLLKPLKLE